VSPGAATQDREGGAALAPPYAPAERLIDPRVAKHGGTRRDAKANYDFPGTLDDATWRRTKVHQHTRYYGCAICGTKFSGPHAVYAHLAKRHDR